MKNINVRLSDELHSKIKTAAQHENRSLQQQIVHVLEASQSGMVYVSTSGRNVIVTDQDGQEVYRFGPAGEKWLPGWRELGRQLIGDEATQDDASNVVIRAAQKILEASQ